MKTLKRAIVGSFLALSVFAAPATAFAAEAAGTPVLVYCISCGTHHLIELQPSTDANVA